MPSIDTRPQAINLAYYPGQTITLTLTFPTGYLSTRTFKSFLGGRTAPGVELTCSEVGDVLTVTADASDTEAFDWAAMWELDIYTAPSTYDTIFVGTWTPGTDGQAVPLTQSFTVVTPDDIAATLTQIPGAGGTVNEITAGTGITVDATDPAAPIVAIASTVYRQGGTDVAVADGGTGSGTAAGARTNLGAVGLTGDETVAGVKTFSSDPIIPDEAYGAGWNGSLEPPTKNAVYDKVETMGGGAIRVEDEGSTVVAAATGMNFAGAGVTVTDAGSNEALVTIPGGGAATFYYDAYSQTSGDITLNATAVTELAAATGGPGTGGMDLVLTAATGDLVTVHANFILSNAAHTVGFDVFTMVAGAQVNPFGAGLSASLGSTQGVSGWLVDDIAQNWPITGSVPLILQAGDISGGTVTLRFYYAKGNTTTRTLFAQTNIPLKIWAINHGAPT